MSCDWSIRCLDCGEEHSFRDANRRRDLMRAIVRNADIIAGLTKLADDPDAEEVELRTHYGRVDPSWFRKHLGHRLAPVSEYGDVDDGRS